MTANINSSRAAIVLAAGQGTRMNSDLAKVLHPIAGKSLIDNVLSSLIGLEMEKVVIVIGHQGEQVQTSLMGKFADLALEFCWQKEQKGTGHAVQQAEGAFSGFSGTVLVMAGDVPFVSHLTLKKLFAMHENSSAAATCLSALFPDPTGYGRIIRTGTADEMSGIIEHRDASEETLQIREINSGIFCFSAPELFSALKEIGVDNSQGELYLTDVIGILNRRGRPCFVSQAENPDEVRGINSPEQLAHLEKVFSPHFQARV